MREVWGHKAAVTALNFELSCGIISCSMAGYDVRVWDPNTLDLLIVLDQQKDGYDLRACHPDSVKNQQFKKRVSQMVGVLDALEVPHGRI